MENATVLSMENTSKILIRIPQDLKKIEICWLVL